VIINTSKLRKNYTIKDMSYLDSDEASAIYKTKADIIRRHKATRIVDVGCRTGEVNKYLQDYEYSYYGFDTSEEPILYGSTKYPDKTFEINDWNNLKNPYDDVDVVIFGSILQYDLNPIELFEKICSFYKPKRAIVHEVNNKNKEDLKYVDLSYFNKYKNHIYEFELDMPVGYRTIIDVQYK
jgi:SAM-dependent methyltransferase